MISKNNQLIFYIILCAVFIDSCISFADEGDVLKVIYPSPQSAEDTRDIDVVELLETALKKTERTDGPFLLQPSDRVMQEDNYRKALSLGRYLTIIWSIPTEEIENVLLPIRIPIRRGILGYRIFLINKKDRNKFASIDNIENLKKLSVGQGSDWGDVKLFNANHFNVVTGDSYEGLFRMLIRGRFDYFSRGINEAFPECNARRGKLPDLFVEEKLALYYPWPKYFFVAKDNNRLAERVAQGLTMMIKDGTFNKIFYKYNQNSINMARLKQRRIFRIDNPLLPRTAPLHQKELWFDPFEN